MALKWWQIWESEVRKNAARQVTHCVEVGEEAERGGATEAEGQEVFQIQRCLERATLNR